MSHISTRSGFTALLLLTAACSQDPAQVVLKGQQTYGRGSSYALNNSAPMYSYSGPASSAPTPAYTTMAGNTASSAGIQPVGVHELSALSPAAGQPTFNSSVQTAPPPSPFAMASSSPSPVNQWTHQPHFTDAENAPNPKPARPQAQPVAQLDNIIGNDGGKNNAKAHPASAEAVAFMWPVNGKHIISAFGPKGGGKTNDGINIAAGEGEPVWASADGEIVYVGNELQGYGNMVLIKHPGNRTSAYAHLSRATVDKYDHVKQGDIIGYVGTTGNVKEPQLHFAIRDGKDPVDPVKYLSRSVASNN